MDAGGTPSPRTVAICATSTWVTTRVSPVISAKAEPAPSSTPAVSTCAWVRVTVPAGFTVMPEIRLRSARIADEPDARSAWICAAVSVTAMDDGTTAKPAMVERSLTAAPVTTKVSPVVLASAVSTPAASIWATVNAIVPESLTSMLATALWWPIMRDPPAIKSACTWAAVSLTAMAVGATGRAATVAISATGTPVTVNVAPVSFANTDPAPSSTCAAVACASVSEMAPPPVAVIDEISARSATSSDEPEVRSA